MVVDLCKDNNNSNNPVNSLIPLNSWEHPLLQDTLKTHGISYFCGTRVHLSITGLQKEKQDCQTLADIAEETRGTNLLNNYNNTTFVRITTSTTDERTRQRRSLTSSVINCTASTVASPPCLASFWNRDLIASQLIWLHT